MYFAYDKNDESIGNWICRTQWNADMKYKVIWNSDYYSKRLSNINEQISQSKLISKFQGKQKIVRGIHNEIINIVSSDQYSIKNLLSYMIDSKVKIRKVLIQMGDIGLGELNIEKFARAAEKYVYDVDLLVSEVSDYIHEEKMKNF